MRLKFDYQKVPGDIHLSYHAHREYISGLNYAESALIEMDHSINHFSFEVIDQAESQHKVLETFESKACFNFKL